jgi:hypothetical protein
VFEGTPTSRDDFHPKKSDRADIIRHQDNLKLDGDFDRPQPQTIGPGERAEVKEPRDNLRPQGEFEGTPRSRDDYIPTKGDRAEIKKPTDILRAAADRSTGTFNRKQHMHSQITLGDDYMAVTNKTYNASNKSAHENKTHKQNQDTMNSTVSTKETKTLADGTILTMTKEATNIVTAEDQGNWHQISSAVKHYPGCQ